MFKKWIYGIVASLLVLVTLGATVAPAFAKTDTTIVIIKKKQIKTNGKPITVTVGKTGVFMPVDPAGLLVELDSIQLSSLPRPMEVLVWNGGLKWNVTDANGKEVFFNANGATVFCNLQTQYQKTALKNHKGVIYYMPLKGGSWRALYTFAAKGGDRAAAFTVGLGYYAFALVK
jgi:hypothetical protein